MSTNIFDTPKTKVANLRKMCGWGKSTVSGTGKEYKICYFKNFAPLVENYISVLPYILLPWGKSTVWRKLMGDKKNCKVKDSKFTLNS